MPKSKKKVATRKKAKKSKAKAAPKRRTKTKAVKKAAAKRVSAKLKRKRAKKKVVIWREEISTQLYIPMEDIPPLGDRTGGGGAPPAPAMGTHGPGGGPDE